MLFLILLVLTLSFKKWKKIVLSVAILGLCYFFGIALVVYNDIGVKLHILKLIISFIIFFFGFFNILKTKKSLKIKESLIFLFIIVFGFFNGLGTSDAFETSIELHQSELLPLIETALGFGASVSILIVALLIVNLLIQKIIKIPKTKWVLGVSILIICISVPMILRQVFY